MSSKAPTRWTDGSISKKLRRRYASERRFRLLGLAAVSISVSDSGPGIPSEDLSRVFERFYRVDKSRSRPGGTGLGLAIVKHLAQAMNGTIAASSVVGKGTTFTLTLPRAEGM